MSRFNKCMTRADVTGRLFAMYQRLAPIGLIALIITGCTGSPTLPPYGSTPVGASVTFTPSVTTIPTEIPSPTATPLPPHPLMIEMMRQQVYPGSPLIFEETLLPGTNYSCYIVSYQSEGNKIYALLTIPFGERPPAGWPVIIFNHGFIPPDVYRTTERYVAYVDGFARHGYIVLKSDYRGHGSSQGVASGGYSSPAYTVDVLNAVSSIKMYPDADPNRIGMWGHSMGGQITLRAMVVSTDIKAGVIWGGVVGSYPELIEHWWNPRDQAGGTPNPAFARRRWRQQMVELYGSPEVNPEFWAAISPNSYLADISGPLQLHHSTTDESVPVILSQLLYSQMMSQGLPVQLFEYEGDDHDITANFSTAMTRSIQFFDEVVKGP
jgi:uncharacterized protein